MKKIFLYSMLAGLLLPACKSIKADEEYPLDEKGQYVLKDMSEKQIEKLIEELTKEYGLRPEQLATIWEMQAEGYTLKITLHESGVFGPGYYKHTHYGLEYFAPICWHTYGSSIATSDSTIIITPNPTSSSVRFRLLAQFVKYDFTDYPVTVDLQLVFNQRIIRQWTINNYHYGEEIIPEEYLKEVGTYALICNFTGPRGCTASAKTSFMKVR